MEGTHTPGKIPATPRLRRQGNMSAYVGGDRNLKHLKDRVLRSVKGHRGEFRGTRLHAFHGRIGAGRDLELHEEEGRRGALDGRIRGGTFGRHNRENLILGLGVQWTYLLSTVS